MIGPGDFKQAGWSVLLGGTILISACSSPSQSAGPLPGAAGNQPPAQSAPAAPAQPAQVNAPSGSVSNCPPAGAATRLDGAGATFPAPLYSRWFNEYNSLCKA